MNFFLLINVKMPTIVGILIFMSRQKIIGFQAYLSLISAAFLDINVDIFILMSIKISYSAELGMNLFYNLGLCSQK